jgi:hypothetical protein
MRDGVAASTTPRSIAHGERDAVATKEAANWRGDHAIV